MQVATKFYIENKEWHRSTLQLHRTSAFEAESGGMEIRWRKENKARSS